MPQLSSLSRRWRATILSLILLLTGLAAPAQTPTWQMALVAQQPSGSTSRVASTATDASGNVYLTGYFEGSITLGSTTLVSAGYYDIFVAKWSPASQRFLWAYRAGGNQDDFAYSLAVQGNSLYIVGACGRLATFGAISVTAATSYVAKLIDFGNTAAFAWLQQPSSSDGARMDAVAVSGANVYVTGTFVGTALTLGNTTLNNVNPGPGMFDSDVFVAKLSDAGATGSFVWAQRAGGSGSDWAFNLAVNGSNVYMVGGFGSTNATFGSTTLSNAGSGGPYNRDGYLAKLVDNGSNGTFSWAQGLSGTNDEMLNAIVVRGSSLYLAGTYGSSTADFGPIRLSNADATGATADCFVAKLNDAGSTSSWVWAQGAGGLGNESGYGLAVSGANLYVAGSFSGTTRFGSSTLTSAGNTDVFVAQLTDTGLSPSLGWAQQAGGADYDYASPVSISGTSLYVGGGVVPAASFGSQLIPGPAVPNPYPGITVAFLASLTDPTLTATRAAQGRLALALAPNPAHGTATVQLPAVAGAPQATLTLSDALGRVVHTLTLPLPAAGLKHELNLSGLAPGIYALRAQAGDAYALRRLVVE